jgi:hypothetical protein
MDQMHLLAIADTISHFSSDVDKLEQFASMPADASGGAADSSRNVSLSNDYGGGSHPSMGGGGAVNQRVALGNATVDECGIRFLMAKKQYEYLLRCLPPAQRKKLHLTGLSSSHIIWAFHSDCEAELLNSLACVQKGEETWEELRAYDIAWWLRNPTSLLMFIERVVKNVFQQDQNPMDTSL